MNKHADDTKLSYRSSSHLDFFLFLLLLLIFYVIEQKCMKHVKLWNNHPTSPLQCFFYNNMPYSRLPNQNIVIWQDIWKKMNFQEKQESFNRDFIWSTYLTI